MKFKGYRIQLELLTVIVYRLIDQSSIFKSIFLPATHRVPIVYYRSYKENEPNFNTVTFNDKMSTANLV